jgi:uncharacterized membrane protein
METPIAAAIGYKLALVVVEIIDPSRRAHLKFWTFVVLLALCCLLRWAIRSRGPSANRDRALSSVWMIVGFLLFFIVAQLGEAVVSDLLFWHSVSPFDVLLSFFVVVVAVTAGVQTLRASRRRVGTAHQKSQAPE